MWVKREGRNDFYIEHSDLAHNNVIYGADISRLSIGEMITTSEFEDHVSMTCIRTLRTLMGYIGDNRE
jgi:hypothetical protein